MRTLALPDTVYQDLVSVAEELAHLSKKPVSPSMAVYMLVAVYRAYLSEPCARDAFRQKMATADLMSPEEFEKVWDVTPLKNDRERVKKKKGR
jgi:hypothetical protein